MQDAFDVYLWLRKAPVDEVKSKLKFYPKKILIFGESSGGNLAAAITLILHDLKTDYKSKFHLPIPMPDALISLYAAFVINPMGSPSRGLGIVEPILNISVLLIIIHALVGMIPNLKPNTLLQTMKSFLFPHSGKMNLELFLFF